MRYYKWLEQGEGDEPLELEASEAEVIKNFYPHWCDLMRAAGKGDQISKEACLEDFMVVHWATLEKRDD